MRGDGRVLTDALEDIHVDLSRRGVPHQWPPPPAPGWAHLPIIVVDLVFNLSRNYDKVARPAIEGYARYAAECLEGVPDADTLLVPHRDVSEPSHRPHTLSESLTLLSPLSTSERKEIFACGDVGAWWSKQAPRRADTIIDAMRAFRDLGVDTTSDLATLWETDAGAVRRTTFGVPGLGKAAFAYLPLLFDRDSVKLDTHVWSFVDSALGDEARSEAEIRSAFGEAARRISDRESKEATMRGLEHFVWRVQSQRAPL